MFIALKCNSNSFGSNIFILDSGASQNLIMSNFEPFMSEVTPLDHAIRIRTANGQDMTATKSGKLIVKIQDYNITINALVPGLQHNLLSTSQLTSKGHRITMTSENTVVSGKGFTLICSSVNGLPILHFSPLHGQAMVANVTGDVWHKRLGHVNKETLRTLGLPVSPTKCSTCVEGKAKKLSFQHQEKRTTDVGELICSDICGPITPVTENGERYMQVILDDFSNFVVVRILCNKSEAGQNLITYVRHLEKQLGKPVKRIRTDCGGEFKSKELTNFATKNGIKMEYTIPYNPQMNGKTERMNGTLLDMIRTKLLESKIPKNLWSEAARASAYELNRRPTTSLKGSAPSKIFHGRCDLSKYVFGCRAWT